MLKSLISIYIMCHNSFSILTYDQNSGAIITAIGPKPLSSHAKSYSNNFVYQNMIQFYISMPNHAFPHSHSKFSIFQSWEKFQKPLLTAPITYSNDHNSMNNGPINAQPPPLESLWHVAYHTARHLYSTHSTTSQYHKHALCTTHPQNQYQITSPSLMLSETS